MDKIFLCVWELSMSLVSWEYEKFAKVISTTASKILDLRTGDSLEFIVHLLLLNI